MNDGAVVCTQADARIPCMSLKLCLSECLSSHHSERRDPQSAEGLRIRVEDLGFRVQYGRSRVSGSGCVSLISPEQSMFGLCLVHREWIESK